MEIEEYVELTMLFDLYGKLLSKKQYEVMDKYLNLNLSESELAGLGSESRQSIHDAVVKAKKQLFEFEEMCHFLSKKQSYLKSVEQLKKYLSLNDNDLEKINETIDYIKNN